MRRDGKPVGASSVTAHLDAVAPGVYLFGQEMPLATIASGDYTLYVTLHGPNGAAELRRADFRVAGPP